MALAGSTWQQLLQAVFADFQRLDFLTQPTPLPSDTIWTYAVEAVGFYQPDIFIPGQALLQWASTFRGQKYYALPPDFEVDGQILLNVYGQNVPIDKVSVNRMDEMDVQIPPVIGPPQYYCIYGTPQSIYQQVTAQWQAGFNYTTIFQNSFGPGRVPYLLLDSNGNIQALTGLVQPGLSGATVPTWPTQISQQVTDGNLTWTTWFNMANPAGSLIRVFPIPDTFYQMTAVYQSIIPIPSGANALSVSNFWTVAGEPMIRHQTEGLLRKNVTHELPQIWQADFDSAMKEYNKNAGLVRKAVAVGRARPYYL